jgi:hypothetical protein
MPPHRFCSAGFVRYGGVEFGVQEFDVAGSDAGGELTDYGGGSGSQNAAFFFHPVIEVSDTLRGVVVERYRIPKLVRIIGDILIPDLVGGTWFSLVSSEDGDNCVWIDLLDRTVKRLHLVEIDCRVLEKPREKIGLVAELPRGHLDLIVSDILRQKGD